MVSFPKWSLLALCLWCAVGSSYSVIFTTTCLKMEENYNFDETKYLGTWYEVRRLYDPSDPEQEDCVVMNYKAGEKGHYDILQSYQITEEGSPIYVSGVAEPEVFENSKVPKFLERYNTTKNSEPDGHVEIVAINYDSYAIVYSCISINASHYTESARVLSRQTQLNNRDTDVVTLFLESHFKRSEHKWRATKQTADFCKPSLVEVADEKSRSQSARLPTEIHLIAMLLIAKMLY
ncbi:apolipoprotein D-like [Anopheles ziemanni]|uniref:apolipoprotein D-like n=1 Tax=Anopheles coustani TaxID=139045 RepID=UPI00265A0A8B|nr:apolipoprotein D-like [Anopheles coustani]XP_058173096.1 apolipoprotein D-like [Anopheles ziemanni]